MGSKHSVQYKPDNLDIISISLRFKIIKEKKCKYNYDHYWVLYIYCPNKYESNKLINYIINNLSVNKIIVNDEEVQYYEPIKCIRKINEKKCKIYCLDRLAYNEDSKVSIETSIKTEEGYYNLTL